MNVAGILGIIAAIQQLTGVVETWRQSEGLSKEELVALARSKDQQLGDFIEAELASLGSKKQ